MTRDDERFEVIAAFADGERVNTDALRDALADEAGRDYFIDLVAMREVVSGASAATRAATAAGGATSAARRRLIGLAAAAVMAVGAAGYAVGHQQSRLVPIAARPPLDADVVLSMETPPAPTHVIRLDGPSRGGGRQ